MRSQDILVRTFAPITPQHSWGSGSEPVDILEQVLSTKHKGHPSRDKAPGANWLDGSDHFMVYSGLSCGLSITVMLVEMWVKSESWNNSKYL